MVIGWSQKNRVLVLAGAILAASGLAHADFPSEDWSIPDSVSDIPFNESPYPNTPFPDSAPSYGGFGGGYGANENPIISLEMDEKKNLGTEMRVAARQGRNEDVLRFLRAGADVNSVADQGETALMYASRNCSIDTVKLLLQNRANINQRDARGRTALVYAIRESCLPVVKLLLSTRHVLVKLKDEKKLTALDYAREETALDVDGPSIEIMKLIKRAESTRPGRSGKSIRR